MDIILFVSVDTVKQMLSLGADMPDKDVVRAILEAQETSLENILGTTLYNKLVEDIKNDTLSGLYKTLVEVYITKYLVKMAGYTLYQTKAVQVTNAGVVRRGSEKYENATMEEISFAGQALKSTGRKYETRLINYLRGSDIPEYKTADNDGDAERATSAFAGFFIEKDWELNEY